MENREIKNQQIASDRKSDENPQKSDFSKISANSQPIPLSTVLNLKTVEFSVNFELSFRQNPQWFTLKGNTYCRKLSLQAIPKCCLPNYKLTSLFFSFSFFFNS